MAYRYFVHAGMIQVYTGNTVNKNELSWWPHTKVMINVPYSHSTAEASVQLAYVTGAVGVRVQVSSE